MIVVLISNCYKKSILPFFHLQSLAVLRIVCLICTKVFLTKVSLTNDHKVLSFYFYIYELKYIVENSIIHKYTLQDQDFQRFTSHNRILQLHVISFVHDCISIHNKDFINRSRYTKC